MKLQSTRTITRSSTITNTKIGVATLAMLGALNIALAAAPVGQNAIAQQPACVAEITSSTRSCVLRSGAGFRDFRYTCPSGRRYLMSSGCRTTADAQRRANAACTRLKLCAAPVRVVVPAPAFPDMAFVGGATFYRDIEGMYKVKFRYTNRGSVDLPVERRHDYRILITALNEQQQPNENNVQSEDLGVLRAGQVFDMVWNRIPEGSFLKFELQIGESMNDQSIDHDLTNNVMIVPLPATPPPLGSDPMPDQYADITVSNISVASSTLYLTVRNQGNIPSVALEAGARIDFSDNNNQMLRVERVALPQLAAQETTQLAFPFDQNNPPVIMSVTLDPESQGNESRLFYPNPFLENNRVGGPVASAPSVVWSWDTPSGAVTPSIGQLIGKLIVSNPATERVALQVQRLAFQIQTNIRVTPENRRYLKIYKDNLAGQPLYSTVWDPEMPVLELSDGVEFEVSPGASKTLFVTLDTVDAVPQNYLSIRPSPTIGLGWSKVGNRWGSTFLNSPPLLFKTLTY